MFAIIKKIFIRILTALASASNHTKCVFLKIKNVRLNLY